MNPNDAVPQTPAPQTPAQAGACVAASTPRRKRSPARKRLSNVLYATPTDAARLALLRRAEAGDPGADRWLRDALRREPQPWLAFLARNCRKTFADIVAGQNPVMRKMIGRLAILAAFDGLNIADFGELAPDFTTFVFDGVLTESLERLCAADPATGNRSARSLATRLRGPVDDVADARLRIAEMALAMRLRLLRAAVFWDGYSEVRANVTEPPSLVGVNWGASMAFVLDDRGTVGPSAGAGSCAQVPCGPSHLFWTRQRGDRLAPRKRRRAPAGRRCHGFGPGSRHPRSSSGYARWCGSVARS